MHVFIILIYILDNINRYHVFDFNVNENMYASSKEIKIRMKSIFQSQRFLIRYVSRDKEDQTLEDVGKSTLKNKYEVQVLFSLVKLKYYLIIIQGINSHKMFYHSKSSKLTLKSLNWDIKTFFHIHKTKIRFNYPICSSFENICIDL